jgi:glutamate-1-semialdehyde 2,1-aminomutase
VLKMDQSKFLYERACQSLATGVSTSFRTNVTSPPMYVERAEGPYFYDADGNQLLDYGLAWGPLIVGNNHPTLTKAVTDQLARGYTYGTQHRGEIELAERMISVLPGAERIIFSNTGSEAVQASLRLARAYTGREKFIKFEGHYHGWLNNVLVSNHPTSDQFGMTVPDCGGQPEAEYSLTITCPWNDLDALKKVFGQHQGQIAAVIGEPILVNGGSCMPEQGFLEGMIKLCHDNGSLCVFDEVITGFRVALGGVREYFGIEPDLSVYAKAMAGGFSISAVAGRKEIFDTLLDRRTSHFGTYNGNPVSIAASIATINILSAPGIYDRMHAHGFAIRDAIEKAATENGKTLITTGTGTAFHVHFGLNAAPKSYRDVMLADHDSGDRFRTNMLKQGIYNLPAGRWYVGATHGDTELEHVVAAVEESMRCV